MSSNDLKILKSYSNTIEAHLIRGMLEENDIFAVVINNNSPYPGTPMGLAQLCVPVKDHEKALELIYAYNRKMKVD